LATQFRLDVTMTAFSVTGNPPVVEDMSWRLAITLYPRVTPFLVFQDSTGTTFGNQLRGAGAMLSAPRACEGAVNQSGVTFDLAWLRRIL
jgi:hypothetical protein